MSTEPQANGTAGTISEEDIVAYLDGELDAETSRQIEARLATDAVARRTLQRLEQAWDALDTLPRADLDEGFTRSTVEMVAVAAGKQASEQLTRRPSRKRQMWLAVVGGALLASLASFFVVRAALGDPNQALLDNLSVLERLEIYREVGEIDFLQELERSGVFSDAQLANLPAGMLSAEPSLKTAPAGLAERRDYVEKLSPVEKDQLRRKWAWFTAADPEAQLELTKLDAALAGDPKSAELTRLMDRYHHFVQALPPETQRKLLGMNPVERVEEIGRMMQFATSRYELSREELTAVTNWLQAWGKEKYGNDQSKLAGIAQSMLAGRMRGFDRFGGGRMPLERVSDAEFADLKSKLSAESRKRLDEKKSIPDQKILLMSWVGYAMHKQWQRQPGGTEAELREFFLKKLSSTQRDRLEALPPERFQEELVRLYRQEQGGGPGWQGKRPGDRPGGERGPGERGPGGPGERGPDRGDRPAGERPELPPKKPLERILDGKKGPR